MSQLVLRPVAVVRSPFKRPVDVPGSGATVEIDVDSQFEGELEGVERSSHLIVVGHFHRGAEPRSVRRWRHGKTRRMRCLRVTLSGPTDANLRDRWQACGTPWPHARRGPRRPCGRNAGPGPEAVHPRLGRGILGQRRRRVRQAQLPDSDLYDFLALDLANHLGTGHPLRA